MEPLSHLEWLHLEPNVSVLPLPARLSYVSAFGFHPSADGLSISNLRFADIRIDPELAQQSIDDDLQV